MANEVTADEATAPSAEQVIVLATDGSQHAIDALAAGLALVGTPKVAVLVTVVPAPDVSVLVGSGHSGPVMTPTQKADILAAHQENARQVLATTTAALAAVAPDTVVQAEIREGHPGEEICRSAVEHEASGIVLGTRGHGGLKRALLGSVSDHVVRNAPCPVITVNTV